MATCLGGARKLLVSAHCSPSGSGRIGLRPSVGGGSAQAAVGFRGQGYGVGTLVQLKICS